MIFFSPIALYNHFLLLGLFIHILMDMGFFFRVVIGSMKICSGFCEERGF